MKKPRIFQIVGLSNSGKTSVAITLTNLLKERNFKVGTIKSAKHHAFDISNKDSDRFLNEGSFVSTVSFSDATQISVRDKLSINEVIEVMNSLSDLDFIIIEGYKREDFDKILVWSPDLLSNIDNFNFSGLKAIFCRVEDSELASSELSQLVDKHSVRIYTDVAKIAESMLNLKIS